ncbi:head scaffolding protein [Mycobacterium phage Predator]|uniref:Uncharacterized protein n=1 Tax=Mycobacterium phage Predator TaxID=543153 RepID=B3VM44_9CAUD|nr:head scaffolding protein [Mycobacterium phage Predator]ACF05114.1 hypothetical protein PREDATOR_17 [Mycobacterium phage Predator]
MQTPSNPTPAPLLAVLDDSAKRNYLNILDAYPIFGGEENNGGNGSGEGNGNGGSGNGNAGGGSGGSGSGGSGTGNEDPIAKLQSDPNALAQLLTQSQTLTSQVQQLTEQLNTATTENSTFKQQQEQAEAAQRTKEQNQEIEINKLKGQLENLTNLLQTKVIENAIANNAKHQWNSTRQVQGELDMSKIKVNLDIDKGIAEIDGMDAELDRIATSSPWLVKAVTTEQTQQTTQQTRQRTSGNPPRPPAPPQDKAAKRAAAMKKFPVLANGSGLPHMG